MSQFRWIVYEALGAFSTGLEEAGFAGLGDALRFAAERAEFARICKLDYVYTVVEVRP